MPRADWAYVSTYPFLLPPLLEQKRIAEVLGCWDEGIEELEKVISLKEQQKKWLMQSLLTGKTRLLGFTQPWREVKLGDIGQCIRGVIYKRDNDLLDYENEQTFRLLRSTNIQEQKIDLKELQILSLKNVSQIQILQYGDMMICMANGSINLVGKSALFNITDHSKYSVGAFCAIYRASGDTYKKIIPFIFQSSKYRNWIKLLTAGSSINNLKNADIESFSMKLASDLEEQSAIAAILSEADNEISQLKQKLHLFKQQKKWLMQQLLTGKKRLAC